jgi:hypothetical protein
MANSISLFSVWRNAIGKLAAYDVMHLRYPLVIVVLHIWVQEKEAVRRR